MIQDLDLQSTREARDCLMQAKKAQDIIASMNQEQIDQIIAHMAKTAKEEASRLAMLAVEETGFGVALDKTVKNLFAATQVYESIRDMKTIGLIARDEGKRVWEVAHPMGIVAGIVPSTNPTSTTIYKSLIAVKSGNAIVFSPHPQAARCTAETARLLQAAAERAGAPQGLISCISQPTMAAVQELMTHPLTDVILATGGSAMVKAAYRSGKPAYGVGPGNVPVYIHPTANLSEAIRLIFHSKTFDNGTICSSEQAIIVDHSMKHKTVAEMKKQGAYFLDDHEKRRVESVLMVNGGLNPRIVGKSPLAIAEIAGILIPSDTRVLVALESGIGKAHPFSIEKLAPILAFYTVRDWKEGSSVCKQLLQFGGLGHTMGIHAGSQDVIEAFGREQPASRIIVNTGTTFGGIGATTAIQPALTLGCGSLGNNITSDNLGPQHLFNIKRIAFGVREMAVREPQAPVLDGRHSSAQQMFSKDELKELIRSVLLEMKG